MIRIAKEPDLYHVARMMRELYKELQPSHYTDDLNVYMKSVIESHNNPKDTIYIEKDKGFFIVRDESEPMTPTLHRYNGIRVFIKIEHRNTSLLARFYNRLFTDFPNGEILGVTELNSKHIQVLDKRHTLLAKVYRLNRR